MRGKIVAVALGLVLGLGVMASTAAAHEPIRPSSYSWPGRYQVRPHWHYYYTPYGVSGYYGTGRHDYYPPRPYSYYQPYSSYYSPYYPSYPSYYGDGYYQR